MTLSVSDLANLSPEAGDIVYRGRCSTCREWHELPSNQESVAAARLWMSELAQKPAAPTEGKMHGVLVGRDAAGRTLTLRAVSGLDGDAENPPGGVYRCGVSATEEQTVLHQLSLLSAAIERLDIAAARARLAAAAEPFDREIARLAAIRQESKRRRTALRASISDHAARQALDRESQHERAALRALRRQRASATAAAADDLTQRLAKRAALRGERRRRSRALQTAMHASRGFVNFAARYAGVAELFGDAGIPSGTGECCAPKLLQEAARRSVRPTGMAEFWWGPPAADAIKRGGNFYGPCATRCEPLLGHLLCGAAAPHPPVPIIFVDSQIIVVDKPAGLRSVPGRGSGGQDNVLSRLTAMHPDDRHLRAAHRLDQATSGLLVIARTATAHGHLARQFAAGSIFKEYEALVGGAVSSQDGTIDLPLRADLTHRPRQVVDTAAGRAATTIFSVVDCADGKRTRLALQPRSGRTHQLRVHCAAGLGNPIIGDTLYGGDPAERLYLHATMIAFEHPTAGTYLTFHSSPPF